MVAHPVLDGNVDHRYMMHVLAWSVDPLSSSRDPVRTTLAAGIALSRLAH